MPAAGASARAAPRGPGSLGRGCRQRSPASILPPSRRSRQQRLPRRAARQEGTLSPFPKVPRPSRLHRRSRAAPAVPSSQRPCRGVSGPRHFCLPPGPLSSPGGGWDGRGRGQEPGVAVGDPRVGGWRVSLQGGSDRSLPRWLPELEGMWRRQQEEGGPWASPAFHHRPAPQGWFWGDAVARPVGFLLAGCSGSGRSGPACRNAEQPQWQPGLEQILGRATEYPGFSPAVPWAQG